MDWFVRISSTSCRWGERIELSAPAPDGLSHRRTERPTQQVSTDFNSSNSFWRSGSSFFFWSSTVDISQFHLCKNNNYGHSNTTDLACDKTAKLKTRLSVRRQFSSLFWELFVKFTFLAEIVKLFFQSDFSIILNECGKPKTIAINLLGLIMLKNWVYPENCNAHFKCAL